VKGLQPGPFLDPQQAGTVMQVHQGRSMSGANEKRFQIIKKNFFVRPGKLLFTVFQNIPGGFRQRMVGKNLYLCRIAEKHLADNGLDPPQATLGAQINTFWAGIWFFQDRQHVLSFIRSGKQCVYYDIRKKRNDAFPGTAGAEAALKAFLRTD
jgi:hypothetical protein